MRHQLLTKAEQTALNKLHNKERLYSADCAPSSIDGKTIDLLLEKGLIAPLPNVDLRDPQVFAKTGYNLSNIYGLTPEGERFVVPHDFKETESLWDKA